MSRVNHAYASYRDNRSCMECICFYDFSVVTTHSPCLLRNERIGFSEARLFLYSTFSVSFTTRPRINHSFEAFSVVGITIYGYNSRSCRQQYVAVNLFATQKRYSAQYRHNYVFGRKCSIISCERTAPYPISLGAQ